MQIRTKKKSRSHRRIFKSRLFENRPLALSPVPLLVAWQDQLAQLLVELWGLLSAPLPRRDSRLRQQRGELCGA
jgi:hypothetical protein